MEITLKEIAIAIADLMVISGFCFSIYKWYKSKISTRLDNLEVRVSDLEEDNKKNKSENALLLKGLLSCLKGLQEQGCDGPVITSINEIETYLLDQVRK